MTLSKVSLQSDSLWATSKRQFSNGDIETEQNCNGVSPISILILHAGLFPSFVMYRMYSPVISCGLEKYVMLYVRLV